MIILVSTPSFIISCIIKAWHGINSLSMHFMDNSLSYEVYSLSFYEWVNYFHSILI